MLENIGENLPEDLKKALPYLLIGGGGAALGGLATGARHKREHETGLGYATRLAKNMALAGLLAGGGSYALSKGVDSVNKSIDYESPRTGSDPELSPTSAAVRGVAFSPFTAGLAGGSALGLTMPNISAGRNDAARSLFKDVDKKTQVSALDQAEFNNLKRLIGLGDPLKEQKFNKRILDAATKVKDGVREEIPGMRSFLSHKAGLPTASIGREIGEPGWLEWAHGRLPESMRSLEMQKGLAGADEKIGRLIAGGERLYRPTLGRILGQSKRQIAGRGALGIGAALLPALIGSLITDPVKQ